MVAVSAGWFVAVAVAGGCGVAKAVAFIVREGVLVIVELNVMDGGGERAIVAVGVWEGNRVGVRDGTGIGESVAAGVMVSASVSDGLGWIVGVSVAG